jgi:hypothetical protein
MNNRLEIGTLRTILAAIVAISLLTTAATSQTETRDTYGDTPQAEFHMARLIYSARDFSRGFFGNNWWAIDYPEAEEHFLPALRRYTKMTVADDSVHLEITDDRIFQYPFLFVQQVGQGNWQPNAREAQQMREYLLRGGFITFDDFHDPYDWPVFETAIRRVLPGSDIVDIPEDDQLMHIFFNLDKRTQIPGRRHLRLGPGGRTVAQMTGPPRWRGIYDERGRLMVAINFNMDMGDAWEHADDPVYPAEMTGLAYRFGINYVLYAMTH